MKIIEKYVKDLTINDQFNIDFSSALFVDIETTGFIRNKNHIYLIGMANMSCEGFKITLLFSENNNEEAVILNKFLELSNKYSTLISFNGLSFDFPFIKERCKKYDLEFNISDFNNIDIYKYVKSADKLLRLPNYKQKSVESFMGINREDKYNGGQLIDVYHNYVKNNSDENLNLLIQHNYDDLLGMIKIMPAIIYSDLKNRIDNIIIDRDKSSDREIVINANLNCKIPTPISLSQSNCFIKISGNCIFAIIKPTFCSLKHYFDDYNNYRYLINEETIIPKALCSTIPKDRLRNVSKDECFVSKESYFVRLYGNSTDNTLTYKTDLKSKENYIELETINEDDQLKKYFLTVLGSIL